MTFRPPPDRPGRARPAGPEDFRVLSAAVAHALRTPLAALSGEVELALHRERTAEAYRAALRRIAERVVELDELTADLASFGSSGVDEAAGTTGLDELLASLASLSAAGVHIEGALAGARLAGDPTRLVRALTLLVLHASRHLADGGRVRVLVDTPPGDTTLVELAIDASPPRFPGRTWLHLEPAADAVGAGEPVNTSGLFRLRTAAHLIEQCGGIIDVEYRDGSDAVRIRLPRAGTNDD